MVVDLDQTLVHTAETEEEKLQLQTGQHPLNLQSNLLDLSPHDHTPGKDLSNLLCIPRASLVGFFRAIRFRYTVFYLTAGTQEYGNAVVEAMREFLLKDNSLDDRDRCWINEAVTRR